MSRPILRTGMLALQLVNQNNTTCTLTIETERGRMMNWKMKSYKLCVVIFISIIMLTACKKETKIDTLNLNSDLLKWLKNTTDIQVYLPNDWEPIIQKKNQNYYLEASGSEENYNIDVYRTKIPVKFNDKNDLLEKNGPVSESDYVGSVSGEAENNTKISFEIPDDSNRLELIKGITAYEKDDGISVWWSQHNWDIAYMGGSCISTLKNFATSLSKADITIADTGNISIVGGNKMTFYYNWEKDGRYYTFVTQDEAANNIVKIVNSFTQIK
jgi:hypothetical protein